MSPINIKSALIQTMAWHRTSEKPISEPIMALFTDAYVHYSSSELMC